MNSVKFQVLKDAKGDLHLAIENYRISGIKPYGVCHEVASFNVPVEKIKDALRRPEVVASIYPGLREDMAKIVLASELDMITAQIMQMKEALEQILECQNHNTVEHMIADRVLKKLQTLRGGTA